MDKPEKNSFWVSKTRPDQLLVVLEVDEVRDFRDTYGSVLVRPMDSQETARVPLDGRWGDGITRVHRCPECELPVPGPHRGTCRYSLMRTGPPELHLPKGTPKITEIVQGGGSLADRIRSLLSPVALYRAAGEEDPTMLAMAHEMESNMAYSGMDDVLIEIAAEVERMENDYRESEGLPHG